MTSNVSQAEVRSMIDAGWSNSGARWSKCSTSITFSSSSSGLIATDSNRVSARNSCHLITSSYYLLISSCNRASIGWFFWLKFKYAPEQPSYFSSGRCMSPMSVVGVANVLMKCSTYVGILVWTLLILIHMCKFLLILWLPFGWGALYSPTVWLQRV